VIENFTSADKFLYHYTSSSTAMEHILKDRSLRLGSYTKTNDPKESKTWQFSLGTNESRDLGKYKMEEMSNWLSNELKLKTKLACFSMDTVPLSGWHFRDIFNRGFAKPRMWAQYARGHTGVCLVFDRQKLHELIHARFEAEHTVVSGRVAYVNRDVVPDFSKQQYTINIDHLEAVGSDAYVRDHLLTHYQQLFFEKMTDWRDESEFRWVVFATTGNDLYVDLTDALVGIVFGENTDPLEIEKMMEITKPWRLRYMGLKWRNCSPWYDYGNPKYFRSATNTA
jgi:hypothetical protein